MSLQHAHSLARAECQLVRVIGGKVVLGDGRGEDCGRWGIDVRHSRGHPGSGGSGMCAVCVFVSVVGECEMNSQAMG